MDKIEEQQKVNNRQIKKLPAEIVGRFLQNLSVVDRLKSEKVSPLWKRTLSKWGWTEQRKMNREIVFEGANKVMINRFWENSDDRSCQLTSLLQQCGIWLHELDLRSFGDGNIERLLPQIAQTLQSLGKLEKLNIGGHRLQDFMNYLPHTLRELKTWGEISVETLQVLSNRCPDLEEVPFQHLANKYNLEAEAVIEPAGTFLRQKKLDLRYFWLRSKKKRALSSIGQLKALEHLDIYHCEFLDGQSLGAIVEGCQQLRSFIFDTQKLTEAELFQLARSQNLTVLQIYDQNGAFTDSVLKTIAQRGQLKKLSVNGSNVSLTDASVVYLVNRCKSMVSQRLFNCPQITERSLEAVIAEVQQRHETVPGTLTSGDLDPGIFYFCCFGIGIDEEIAEEQIDGNPWLRFGDDPRQII